MPTSFSPYLVGSTIVFKHFYKIDEQIWQTSQTWVFHSKAVGIFFHFHVELEIGALLRRHLFISRLAPRPRRRYTGNQGKSGQGRRLSKRCDACEKLKRICYGIRGEGGEISQIPAVLLAPIKSSRVTWRFQNEAVGCQNTARRK